jgi:hypothetical protein
MLEHETAACLRHWQRRAGASENARGSSATVGGGCVAAAGGEREGALCRHSSQEFGMQGLRVAGEAGGVGGSKAPGEAHPCVPKKALQCCLPSVASWLRPAPGARGSPQ